MDWHTHNIDTNLLDAVSSIMESAGTGKYFVHKTPLDKAKEMAIKTMGGEEQLMNSIPDFDKRYKVLESSIKKYSKNIKRIDMPVIDAHQINDFERAIESGKLDILKPFAHGKFVMPDDLTGINGDKWVELGYEDGNAKDDVVRGKITRLSADKLKPVQREIHFDKVMGNIKKFGVLADGSPPTNMTIIVSSDNFIIDGHHRWAVAVMTNPNVKLRALVVPLKIDKLLDVTRGFGDAIGNARNP